MAVRPPADHRAEVRQDGVVQQRNFNHRNRRPQDKDGQRHKNDLCAIGRPDVCGRILPQQINQPAHVPDQGNVAGSNQYGQHTGDGKNRPERAEELGKEWPKPPGRRVALLIGEVGVDEALEKSEHGGSLSAESVGYSPNCGKGKPSAISPADRRGSGGTPTRSSAPPARQAFRPAPGRTAAASGLRQ